jgi:hypothetical protein
VFLYRISPPSIADWHRNRNLSPEVEYWARRLIPFGPAGRSSAGLLSSLQGLALSLRKACASYIAALSWPILDCADEACAGTPPVDASCETTGIPGEPAQGRSSSRMA